MFGGGSVIYGAGEWSHYDRYTSCVLCPPASNFSVVVALYCSSVLLLFSGEYRWLVRFLDYVADIYDDGGLLCPV